MGCGLLVHLSYHGVTKQSDRYTLRGGHGRWALTALASRYVGFSRLFCVKDRYNPCP
eukprot:c41672_g1_i1 orf=13-183(-)